MRLAQERPWMQGRAGAAQFITVRRRDVRTLLDASMDHAYLERWAARLGVTDALSEILR